MTTLAVSQQPGVAAQPYPVSGQSSPVSANQSSASTEPSGIEYIPMPSPTSASISPHAPLPDAPITSPRGSVMVPPGLRRTASYIEQKKLHDEVGMRPIDPSHQVRVTSGFQGFINSRVLPTLTYISFWPPVITVSGSILALSTGLLHFSFELMLIIVLINVGSLLISAFSHIYLSNRIKQISFREAREEKNQEYDRARAEGNSQAAALMQQTALTTHA